MELWEPFIDCYLAYFEELGRSQPPCATPMEIDLLQTNCQSYSLFIDSSYKALLGIVNGTGYDGLTFYGIGIDRDDQYGRIDLIDANELIEERANDTLYGQWQDEFFVRVASTGHFERRGIVTGNARETFETCESLLVSILKEEVEYLNYRHRVSHQK